MTTKKTHPIWDFLVLWPFIYFLLLMVIIPFLALSGFADDPTQYVGGYVALGFLLMVVHFATVISMVVVYVYAIHRLYTATKLSNDSKRTWLILIVIFNVLAIPFLHFKHLRK